MAEALTVIFDAIYHPATLVAILVLGAFLMAVMSFFNSQRSTEKLIGTINLLIEKDKEKTPILNTLETMTEKWDPRSKKILNQVIDVLNPMTNFTKTDIDNDVLAWFRDVVNGREGNESEDDKMTVTELLQFFRDIADAEEVIAPKSSEPVEVTYNSKNSNVALVPPTDEAKG